MAKHKLKARTYTDISRLSFEERKIITHIDLRKEMRNFRPKLLTGLFSNFHSLQKITGFDNLDTSHVKSMYCMFQQCFKLKSIDLSDVDFSKCENLSHMFWNCRSLKRVDLSRQDLSKVKTCQGMFRGCECLKEVDIRHTKLHKKAIYNHMFEGCPNLKSFHCDRKLEFIADEYLQRSKLMRELQILCDEIEDFYVTNKQF